MEDLLTITLQQTINGLVVGSLYVLVALGLTLIYGILNQINFAHADFVTLGAFAAYFAVYKLGVPYLASIIAALAAGALLGVLVNLAVFAPLRARGDELRPLIATIGVSILMENGQLALFGNLVGCRVEHAQRNRFGLPFLVELFLVDDRQQDVEDG